MTGKTFLLLLVGALLLGGFGGCYLAGQQARERAAADQATIASLEQSIATLNAQQARIDTVYAVQRDTLVRRLTRWDTVRSVERFTDTLVSVDTLRLVVQVADSAIQACTALVGTCEDQKALLRQRIALDSSALRSLSRELARARVRNRLGCTLGPGATTTGLDYLAVSCGVRIF